MKTLSFATPNLSPLLWLTCGLALLHPCTAAPFQFEQTGSMHVGRVYPTTTLLNNGKVLVTGGQSFFDATFQGGSLPYAEVYDPVSNTWSSAGSMSTARTQFTAAIRRLTIRERP